MYRPNATMIRPATTENARWLPVKNCPRAVNPNPRRKKAKLTPTTKNTVFTSTVGRTQGEKKLKSPCTNTVMTGTLVPTSKPMTDLLAACPRTRSYADSIL